MLVFQQSGDPTVSVTISEQLAAARSDLVTSMLDEGQLHKPVLEQDRARYERAVRAWSGWPGRQHLILEGLTGAESTG